jgi:hypothetical protein
MCSSASRLRSDFVVVVRMVKLPIGDRTPILAKVNVPPCGQRRRRWDMDVVLVLLRLRVRYRRIDDFG